jgi:hypothetical protein
MHFSPVSRSVALLALTVLLELTARAQPPAAPAQPAGRGGGRGAGAPALSVAQTAAAGQMQVPAVLTTAATAAANALAAASLAQPRNDGDIAAKAQVLADAELKLALARADGFAEVQTSLQKMTTAQAIAAFGGGRGGGAAAAPAAPDDYAGFTRIFDGETLAGWDGDPMFWRVEDGMIIAESTPTKVVGEKYPLNTFLIWRGGVLKDFELKIDARFPEAAGNSGIQTRSRMVTTGRGGVGLRPWGMGGYQNDLLPNGGDGSAIWFGEDGGGRMSGHVVTRRLPDGSKQIATIGSDVNAAIKPPGEWNSYHIIVKANVFLLSVNGRLASVLIDENQNPAQGYALEGLLGLQMHVGAPFKLEFRNIYYKDITQTPQPLGSAPTATGGGRGGN